MGTLPRKIDFEKVIGYIHSDKLGLFSCENGNDKEKLIALLQIYVEGLEHFLL